MSLALELAQTQIARAKPAEEQVPKTARAAIYARYSSHKQQELSIEGQLREIQEYCQKKDLKIVRAYIDRAKSGRTSTKRTEFRRMLEDAKQGEFDTIVVYKFNRFFRNLTEQVITMEDLRKVSVTMQSVHDVVPEGSGGVYMRAIYGADAEVYSLGVSEDTKRGMRDAAADYRTPGSLPMWLMADANKKIVLNEPAARVMRQAAVMYDEGATLRQCCEYINAAGYKTRQGHKWNPTTLSASFRNVRLMGVFRFKDEILKEGIFPAAVEPDLWRRINAKLDGKHMPQRARALEEYYLTPRLFCGLCGAPMYGAIAYGAMSHGVKNVYRYYRCDNRLKNHSCKQKLVRKEIVEDAVFRAVIGTLTDENIARIALQAEKLSAETATTGAEKLRLLDELAAVNTEINNISRAIAAGIITDTTRDMLIDAERRRTGIQQRIEDAEAKEKETVRAEDVAAWLYCFREGAKKDEELKAQILRRLVARAELFEDGPHDGHVVVWCKLADAETAITEFFERTPAGGAKKEHRYPVLFFFAFGCGPQPALPPARFYQQHHGAAQLIAHAGQIQHRFGRRGLSHAAHLKPVFPQGLQVSGEGAVIFRHGFPKECGGARPLFIIVVYGKMQDAAICVIHPFLRALCREHGVLGAEHKPAARAQPVGNVLHQAGPVLHIMKGQRRQHNVKTGVWKAGVFHGAALVCDGARAALLLCHGQHFFRNIHPKHTGGAMVCRIHAVPAISAAKVQHAAALKLRQHGL